MFWRKKKNDLPPVEAPSLQTLASRLGVERRKNIRVNYPPSGAVCKMPDISFEGTILKIQNISVGGCCLLDPQEFLGPSIAQDVELYIHWPTATEALAARIVSRVDHRRHIQFLNLPAYRQNQLSKSMSAGVRGVSLRSHAVGGELAPTVEAAELWSSLLGDSLTLENDVHKLAQIHLENCQYTVFRQSWPVKNGGKQCTRFEYEQILLFLANVPVPSQGLKDLMALLTKMLSERAP